MKIAICDDNKHELLHIRQLVEDYLCHNFSESKIEVCCFESSIELIAQIENGKRFDVFLLDVIMPITGGIELASEIRNKDQIAKIIFLTSSPEFAVASYSVDAFHYLLKPIQKSKLFSVLDKACSDILQGQKQYIIVKTQPSLSKIFLHELIYVEVLGRTVCFHSQGRMKIESTSTMSQVEKLLLVHKFFVKPHRSYIVNLEHIQNLSQDGITTTSGVFIPISRNAFKGVKQAYINYSFQG